MIIGRVVGEVWATRRHAGLDGCKLRLVQPHLWYSPPFEVAHLVAVDTLGAGLGEDVVVCMGEPARRALAEAGGQADDPGWDAQIGYLGAVRLPVDAAVMAIVDQVQIAPGPGPGDSQLLGARPLRFVGPTPAWASPSSESAPSPSLSSEPRGAA